MPENIPDRLRQKTQEVLARARESDVIDLWQHAGAMVLLLDEWLTEG